MVTSLYKSAAGRDAVLAAYDRGVVGLTFPVRSRVVETRFGSTHMLVAGPTDAPPLLVVHGANGSADQMAAGLPWCAAANLCHYLDVPGEPNRSSEVRPGKRGDGLGLWLGDVLGGLGIERSAMLGISGGAYAVLKAAAVIPARVERAVLLVPEGLSTARPLAFLMEVLWPMIRYGLRRDEANARRVMAVLTGLPAEEVPTAALERFRLVLDHVKAVADRGPMLTAAELAGFVAPVFIVAAGRDAVFPGEAAVQRARQVLNNFDSGDVVFLPEAGHVHPDVVGPAVARRVGEFLGRPRTRT